MSTVLTSKNKLKLLKICRKINPKGTQMLEVPEFIDPLSSVGTQLQDSDKDEILKQIYCEEWQDSFEKYVTLNE